MAKKAKKKWQQAESEELERIAASSTLAELAERFKTDVDNVRAQLDELGLTSAEGLATPQIYDDPLVQQLGEGMQKMYAGKWQEALKLLEPVADNRDILSVAERARQLVHVCHARLAPPKDEAGDPFLHAVYLKNQGRLAEVHELCQKKDHQRDERFVYLLASLHALGARLKDAAADLARAIEMNPKNRVYAYHDPDFEGLRQHKEYAYLFGLE